MASIWRLLFVMVLLAGSPARGEEAEAIDVAGVLKAEQMPPVGYAVAAYLDCGQQPTARGNDGQGLRILDGKRHTFGRVAGPLDSAVLGETDVEIELTGLQQGRDYVLGFTWWDADNLGRVQSVRFERAPDKRSIVLPPTRAAAFYKGEPTWASGVLPVPSEYTEAGAFTVAFVREAGPSAVLNEVWLLEKSHTDARKRVLIVTGDDYPGHLWRETAPELAAILRTDPRLDVWICEIPAIYGSPLIGHYDATLLHFKNYRERLPLDAPVWEGLRDHVRSGRGLVIAHFGCGAFQEWDGFVKVAGRVWDPALRAHDPYGPFTVNVADAHHPVTAGMPNFETQDELYTCLTGTTPLEVLCTATSREDNKAYPIAFSVLETGGRVVHCALGHDVNALRGHGVRALYRRAVCWAAGLRPEETE